MEANLWELSTTMLGSYLLVQNRNGTPTNCCYRVEAFHQINFEQKFIIEGNECRFNSHANLGKL